MRSFESSGAEPLDNAAQVVLKLMHSVPSTINGKPSPLWTRFAINFKLDPP